MAFFTTNIPALDDAVFVPAYGFAIRIFRLTQGIDSVAKDVAFTPTVHLAATFTPVTDIGTEETTISAFFFVCDIFFRYNSSVKIYYV